MMASSANMTTPSAQLAAQSRTRKVNFSRRVIMIWFLVVQIIGVLGPLLVLNFGMSRDYIVVRYGLQSYVYSALGLDVLFACISLLTCLFLQIFLPTTVRGTQEGNGRGWLVAWLIFLAAYCLFLLANGPSVAQTLTALSAKVRDAVKFQSAIFMCMGALAVMSTVYSLSQLNKARRSKRDYMLVIVVTAVTATVCFISGSRARTLVVVACPVIYMLGMPKLRWLFLMPAFAGVVYLFELGDALRRAAQGVSSIAGDGAIVKFLGSLSILDSTAVAIYIANVAPKDVGDALSVIFSWIMPSFIVGDKAPIGSINARFVLEGDFLGGITLSTPGDFYYYFGIGGIVFGAMIWGALISIVSTYSERKDYFGYILFYLAFYMSFITIRNGVFNDVIEYILIISILLMSYLFRLARGNSNRRRG